MFVCSLDQCSFVRTMSSVITTTMTPRMPVLDIQANNLAAPDESLHRFIRRSVLTELEQKWKPGMRIPPVRQIAARFGVGIATAQQAIRELVNEGILISRPKLGTVVAPDCDPQRIRSRITEGRTKTRFA